MLISRVRLIKFRINRSTFFLQHFWHPTANISKSRGAAPQPQHSWHSPASVSRDRGAATLLHKQNYYALLFIRLVFVGVLLRWKLKTLYDGLSFTCFVNCRQILLTKIRLYSPTQNLLITRSSIALLIKNGYRLKRWLINKFCVDKYSRIFVSNIWIFTKKRML